MDRTYLAAPEAAEYIGTSVRFIRRLVAERRIAFHKAGNHVRLAVADLDAYMQSGRVEPITRASVARDLWEVA